MYCYATGARQGRQVVCKLDALLWKTFLGKDLGLLLAVFFREFVVIPKN
jgi:hypothetical protein